VTIFLGCGFAAKYREGGGVLSVPLQWMLDLRRLKLDAVWLELLPGDKCSVRGPGEDRQFSTAIARAWIGWPILFTLSEAGVGHA